MFALYALLVVFAAALIAIVYRYDLYDREPWWAMLAVVVLGAALMHIAGFAQIAMMSMLGASAAADWNLSMAIAAGTSEELAKVGAVLVLAVGARRCFNDPIDGLIYGSLAGLGAALQESVVLLSAARPLDHLPAAEPVRLAGHLVMGGISGFGLGAIARAKARPPRWAIPASLMGGIVLHTGWDVVAFSAADARRMLPWHTAASVGLMFAGFGAYRWLVQVGARLSARAFAGASAAA